MYVYINTYILSYIYVAFAATLGGAQVVLQALHSKISLSMLRRSDEILGIKPNLVPGLLHARLLLSYHCTPYFFFPL